MYLEDLVAFFFYHVRNNWLKHVVCLDNWFKNFRTIETIGMESRNVRILNKMCYETQRQIPEVVIIVKT
jgi:hypothetical protein